MPDLSEILKGAVDDIPDFDPAALATRRRRQRRVQAASAASVLVVIAAALVFLLNTGSDGVVVSTRKPAATSTESFDSTTSSAEAATMDTVPPSTIPPSETDTTGSTTTIPGARAPQVGDFTGTLTASATTVHVGEGVDLDLRIHNASGDVIDTSRDERPTNLELYCDTMPDPGPPARSGTTGTEGEWFLPSPTMQPGADGVITAHFVPADYYVGRANCEAVVVENDVPVRFFPVWHAILAIDPVIITVLPANGATTTVATVPPTSTGSTATS